jgi:hypothetical protein
MFEQWGIAAVSTIRNDVVGYKITIANDIVLSLIGMGLSAYSITLDDEDLSHAVDVIALIVSLSSFYFSAKDLKNVKGLGLPDTSPRYILLISTIISGVGLSKSIYDVRADYFA